MGDQYDSFGGKRRGFTDPEVVSAFVQESGVDFLAIAFGNAHGLYKGTPSLDYDLVAEVRRRVDVPLVMHGGTGISDEQFRKAITAGICKINFATSILHTAVENMRRTAANPAAVMDDFGTGIRSAYYHWSTHLFDVYGTSSHA
jgi:fructose-bisphosphate aldolase class II